MKKLLLSSLYLLLFFSALGMDKWKDPSNHSISFITVTPEIRLEVLDWGGTGEPLLFLSGLGNTGHVFDEFAPLFTDKYHVLALTRRGFGASSQPGSGYDLSTLSHDILAVIDSLKIERITLIGHSIAGDEMTKFAALYPGRINKLIYLDAAYDRTDMGIFQNAPPPPPMTGNDSSTLWTIQSYNQKTFGIRLTETEFRSACIFDEDGNYVGEITADSTIGAIIAGVEKPAYESVKAPALALYAIPSSIQQLIPFFDQLDEATRITADSFFGIWKDENTRQVALFKKEMAAGKTLEVMGGHHYLFISHPELVALEIRKFLEE